MVVCHGSLYLAYWILERECVGISKGSESGACSSHDKVRHVELNKGSTG
jgi:hypothetical protein